MESLNVGVLAVDLNGTVDAWNSRMEQLIGVTRAEAVGRLFRDLLPEDLVREIEARGDEDQVTGILQAAARISREAGYVECFHHAAVWQIRRKNRPVAAG